MHDIIGKIVAVWSEQGFSTDGGFKPTFIEEVGQACAENVRSAAICRWMNSHKDEAIELLNDLGCTCNPKDILVQREISFNVERKEEKNKKIRIDLGVFQIEKDSKIPIGFIELKWLADQGYKQLELYSKAIDQESGSVPLYAISPVKSVWGILDSKLNNIFFRDFEILAKHISPSVGGNSDIDADIAHTLNRWRLFSDIVREAVHDTTTTIQSLSEMHSWLEKRKFENHVNAPIGFGDLLKRIIVAELADMLSVRTNDKGYVRCLTAQGAHRDMQADVADRRESSFFRFDLSDNDNYGMLVNIRFRIPKGELKQIQVSLGSSKEPYQARKQLEENKKKEHCQFVRDGIKRKLDKKELSSLPLNYTYKWKCSHTEIFRADHSIQDVLEHAEKLFKVLRELRSEITE